jgi:TetR/AcrR family transcriptional repressor of nem operon
LNLALDMLRNGLLAGLDEETGPELLRKVAGRYLSRTHRDHPESGCPLPALAGELAREGPAARDALQRFIENMAAGLAPRTPAAPGLSPEDRVLATLALFCGAMTLARAVPDEELSERILRSARRLAVPETAEVAAAKTERPKIKGRPK